MDTCIFREMKLEDIPTLLVWGNSVPELWGSEEGKWYTQKGLTEWIQEKGNDILLVAEVDGKLAGMCMSRYMFEWYSCDTLYVAANYRKSGVGKLLLEETEKQVKAHGVSVLSLWSHADNDSAISFYKKTGFQNGFSGIWMEKRLKI
jgi:ribosomal protein S18 acetylase RimI-like enzyme